MSYDKNFLFKHVILKKWPKCSSLWKAMEDQENVVGIVSIIGKPEIAAPTMSLRQSDLAESNF